MHARAAAAACGEDGEVSESKMRHCWNCGAEMGLVEDRHYDRSDTCGKRECDRAAREQHEAEREEAHERLDRDMGW